MPRSRVLERLCASDLFLLMRDDYGSCSDIGAVTILDGIGLLDDHGGVSPSAFEPGGNR